MKKAKLWYGATLSALLSISALTACGGGDNGADKYDNKNRSSDNVADSADGCGQTSTEVFNEIRREIADGFSNLRLQIWNTNTLTEFIQSSETEARIIQDSREVTDEFDRFACDSWYDNGDKRNQTGNYNKVGESDWGFSTLTWNDFGQFINEWRNSDGEE